DPPHPILLDPDSPNGLIRFLPSHPHEGTIGKASDDPTARVIATGRSQPTGVAFNIAVAFDASVAGGPAIVHSTTHHFADYNRKPENGAPSFVKDPPTSRLHRSKDARRSVEPYARTLALWLVHPGHDKIRLDRALDEALKESFPASDPPSVAAPT